MAVDDLVAQGTRASVTMIIIMLTGLIRFPHVKGRLKTAFDMNTLSTCFDLNIFQLPYEWINEFMRISTNLPNFVFIFDALTNCD